MYKKRLRLLSHVYIGLWVRKPLLWAVHRSFSMQYGSYKDVLFPVPTHSESFLCFHCFYSLKSCMQPILSPFILLLLCPASFFSLFAGCSGVQTLNLSSDEWCLPLTAACSTGQSTEHPWRDPSTHTDHRLVKLVAQHLACVSSISHTPSFILQKYIYIKEENTKHLILY